MTTVPYSFKKFLCKNTIYNNGRKHSKKDIIKAVILAFYDINPAKTLGIKKQSLSILFKKAYGHLLDNKPRQVPISKYLLFLAGYKRCKISKEIYYLSCFKPSNTTWDGFVDHTTEGSSLRYFANKKTFQEYIKQYRKNNSDVIARITAKYRASKLSATPTWLTKEQVADIATFYRLSKKLEEETGVKHHVDHIVPLQGKNVCGLHVPWNLRVIPASENIIKSNKFS